MIGILKVGPGGAYGIEGWILAVDAADARRQAEAALNADLATELYTREMEIESLPSGRYELRTPGCLLLKGGWGKSELARPW